ncbi:hypothetical protein SY88_05215 [Clostridiales bacterium PH28_bin88]|nr:hypothetical protein SY88_05215 [Clostridiales bacterium PH28_bin88]
MYVGARIIKTGLAVTISMYLAKALHLSPAVFAAITAVVNLKPSVAQSWKDAFQQITTHIISVIIALAIGYILGGNPLTMGLSSIIIIFTCLKLNWKNSLLMGIVAAIFILDSSEAGFLAHAINRSTGIFIGLGVALTINSLLAPPKYKNRLLDTLQELHQAAVSEFEKAVTEFITLKTPERYTVLDPLANKTKELLQYYHDEINYKGYLRFAPRGDDTYYLFLKHLTDYSVGLMERAENIRQIIPARIDRRKKAGNLPLSEEYQQIQSMLLKVSKTVHDLNDKLRRSYIYREPVEPEEIRDDFWIELNTIIEKWQHKFSGHFYLHALMEVALVAHETRWAAREAKRLLFETINIDQAGT